MRRPKILTTAALSLTLGLTIIAHEPEAARSTASPVALDVPFAVATRAFDVTDSGDIVGLYITADTRVHGFLLTRGVYTSIEVPGAVRTNAVGVAELREMSEGDDDDHDGFRGGKQRRLAVVGRYDTPDTANPMASITHGYVLRDDGLMTIDHPEASTVGVVGAINTVTTGINSSGHIVGRYRGKVDNQLRGFVLADGEFTTPIELPEPMYSININDKGDIAGYYGDSTGRSHAFVLRNGVLTTIDPPDSLETGQNAGVIGINSRVVVGFYRFAPATMMMDGRRAFVYSLRDGSLTTFALPEPVRATAFFGINRRGDIVGNFVDADRREHGLLLPRHK